MSVSDSSKIFHKTKLFVPEKSIKQTETVKSIIKEGAILSTFHGIPRIARTNSILIRLIWILSLIAAICYFTYNVCSIYRDFLSYKTVTQVYRTVKPSIEFPTVMFCNKNPFNTDNQNFLLKTIFDALAVSHLDDYVIKMWYISEVMLFMQYISKSIQYKPQISDTQRRLMGFQLDQMLLSCYFNNQPCSRDDFEHVYTFSYGNCYKFNSGKNLNGRQSTPIKHISNPGKKHGLKLEIFVGHPVLENNFIRSYGAHLFVNEQQVVPLSEIEGISLATGFETDVVIDQVNFNKLSKPYSDCIMNVDSPSSFDSFLYRTTVQLTKTYRQKYCLQLCYQQFLERSCNCSDAALPATSSNLEPCNELVKILCAYSIYANFTNTPRFSSCFDDCPLECKSVQYNLATSQSEYPSLFYGDFLIRSDKILNNSSRNFSNYAQLKETILSVNVFYDDISYSVVNEVPAKTLEQFIADLGGYMGLTLGSSLLSLIEILELF